MYFLFLFLSFSSHQIFQNKKKKYPSFDWCLDQTPQSLGVGRYSQLQTITMDTSLNNAINLLTQHRISALPIVDGNGCYYLFLHYY